jgi:hypothetical protein
MSASAAFKRWPIATWLFCLHAFLILAVYILWLASSHDVERDMIWLWARIFDFPVATLEDIVNPRYGLPTALTCILIGGLQWALVGLILDLLRRSLIRGASLRDTRNI